LHDEIVDRRGLEAEARLFGPLVEVPDATVIGFVSRPVGRPQATAAVAANDQAGEQRGAAAGAPLRSREKISWLFRTGFGSVGV
jgi:hypothetical protein